MSFLKVFCAVNSRAGILNIAGLGHATITLLGCSACTSLSPKEYANSLLVTDLHEAGDLIAIILSSGKSEMPYLIEIEKRDGIPYINLEKPESNETWVPKPDRMIQLFKNGFMRVKIDDEWFTTYQNDREKGHRILPISAGNLMVKYAYGLAEAKEIIDLAEEIQTQADAVEMLEVEKAKKDMLLQQIREHENCISELMCDNTKIVTALEEIYIPINAIEDEADHVFANKKIIKRCAISIRESIMKIEKALGK